MSNMNDYQQERLQALLGQLEEHFEDFLVVVTPSIDKRPAVYYRSPYNALGMLPSAQRQIAKALDEKENEAEMGKVHWASEDDEDYEEEEDEDVSPF